MYSKKAMLVMMGERNPCALLVGMEIGAATGENSMGVSQKTENRVAILPSNPSSGLPARQTII